jgi:hypothetical protein
MKTFTSFWFPVLVFLGGCIVLAVMLCGCGAILPREKQTTMQASQAATISGANNTALTKQTENLLPSINVSGASNTVNIASLPAKTTVAATNGAATGVATESAGKEASKVSIPLGVKLCLLAVGLALLAVVIVAIVRYVKTQSAAGAAAIALADRTIAAQITKFTNLAMTEQNPQVMAQHAANVAELEKERGKLNSL